MIKLEHLTKIYETGDIKCYALNDVSLTIQPGETVAIMGKSGAGKTTLMNMIGCLDVPTSGRYFLGDTDISGLRDKQLSNIRNQRVGFVMQDFALLPHKSVLHNVMLPMYFDKTPWGEMKKAALAALKRVGIAEQKNKKVNQLSGGQKQRVAIARAMVKSPEILLADEPTGALDSATGHAIMETLMGMNQTGTTVIVVTHDAQVASYCRRKITISDGKVISDVTTDPL